MRTRTLLVVPLLASFAFAAPVPKAEVPKIEDVFGEIADKESKCKFEMGKGGVLALTVPRTHPSIEPNADSATPPMVSKRVEGDFVLTVRTVANLPRKLDAKEQTARPAVLIGVSMMSADSPGLGITVGAVRRMKEGEWEAAQFTCFREPNYADASEAGLKVAAADPTWFRITRRAKTAHVETSTDGKKWTTFVRVGVTMLGETLTVGPVAFGCVDQEFSATFDQYEIKPLLKDEKK